MVSQAIVHSPSGRLFSPAMNSLISAHSYLFRVSLFFLFNTVYFLYCILCILSEFFQQRSQGSGSQEKASEKDAVRRERFCAADFEEEMRVTSHNQQMVTEASLESWENTLCLVRKTAQL